MCMKEHGWDMHPHSSLQYRAPMTQHWFTNVNQIQWAWLGARAETRPLETYLTWTKLMPTVEFGLITIRRVSECPKAYNFEVEVQNFPPPPGLFQLGDAYPPQSAQSCDPAAWCLCPIDPCSLHASHFRWAQHRTQKSQLHDRPNATQIYKVGLKTGNEKGVKHLLNLSLHYFVKHMALC